MIDKDTQPNQPYVWELMDAMKAEAQKLIVNKVGAPTVSATDGCSHRVPTQVKMAKLEVRSMHVLPDLVRILVEEANKGNQQALSWLRQMQKEGNIEVKEVP